MTKSGNRGKHLAASLIVAGALVGGVSVAGAVRGGEEPVVARSDDGDLNPDETREIEEAETYFADLYDSGGEILVEDADGDIGWVSFQQQQDARIEALEGLLDLAGADPGGDVGEQEIGDAYQVLAALEVREEPGGTVIGYLGPDGLIEHADYPAARSDAAQTILDAGGTLD